MGRRVRSRPLHIHHEPPRGSDTSTARPFHCPPFSLPALFTTYQFHCPPLSLPGHFTARPFHCLPISLSAPPSLPAYFRPPLLRQPHLALPAHFTAHLFITARLSFTARLLIISSHFHCPPLLYYPPPAPPFLSTARLFHCLPPASLPASFNSRLMPACLAGASCPFSASLTARRGAASLSDQAAAATFTAVSRSAGSGSFGTARPLRPFAASARVVA